VTARRPVLDPELIVDDPPVTVADPRRDEIPNDRRLILAAQILWAHRKLVVAVVAVASVIGVTIALSLPPVFTAQASFYPETRSSDLSSALGGGGLGSLAGAASAGGLLGGLNLGGNSTQSPTFFADLFKSQSFLDSMLVSTITVDSTGKTDNIAHLLVPKSKTEGARRWGARKRLKHLVEVEVLPSGVVQVSIEAKTAVAAAAMTNRAVDIIDELNIAYRKRQAASRREFTATFLLDVTDSLNAAENRLEGFLLANRSMGDSPVLKARYTRLSNEVERLQGLEQSLASNIENARLSESNSAPVVARVDRASVPELKSGPHRSLIAMGTVFFASLLLGWWAYARAGQPRRPA
jgi:hypothetical protein